MCLYVYVNVRINAQGNVLFFECMWVVQRCVRARVQWHVFALAMVVYTHL